MLECVWNFEWMEWIGLFFWICRTLMACSSYCSFWQSMQVHTYSRKHVSSGSVAYRGLPVLEVVLQIVSIALIGIPAINHGAMSVAARTTPVSMAVICFVDSRLFSYFIYKAFHFHDHTHAFCRHHCFTYHSEIWTSHCIALYIMYNTQHSTLA